MRAIDADRNVQEPTEQIARHLPAHPRDCARTGLCESAKAKILRGNALRCFGLRA
jgi:hypothetical protein